MIQKIAVCCLTMVVMLESCHKEETLSPGGTAAADYQPVNAGSRWNYSSTSTGNFTVQSLGTDSLINGLKYFKFDRISMGASTRYYENKTNGVYRQYIYVPQASQTVDLVILKDSAIGTTWTNALSVSGFSNYHKYTVTARGIQRVVNGITYNNVIELNYQLLVDNPLGFGPPVSAGTGKNYYAKGVGAIESFYLIGLFGININDTTRLISYTK